MKATDYDLNKKAQEMLNNKLGFVAEITLPLEDVTAENGVKYQLQLVITSDESKIVKVLL